MEKMLLTALPWLKPDHISIQLGDLKAYLQKFGILIATRHYYKDILSYLPNDVFYKLWYANAGEYFSLCLLFPQKRQDILNYLSGVLRRSLDLDALFKSFAFFIEDVAADMINITEHTDYLIGFSVSHQQIVTSLLAAQKIKEQNPDCRILFGGAVMLKDIAVELLRSFDQIDMIIYGEGEEPLRKLLESQAHLNEDNRDAVPGLVFRKDGKVIITHRKELADMSALPIPDYTDYFNYSLRTDNPVLYPKISIETSRGCFYGNCSFCNLNSQWKAKYRAKQDEQVYQEIVKQTKQHHTVRLLFVDSNVSNRGKLFQMMASDTTDYHGWAEVSGHLTKEVFVLMRKAGIKDIQIGIESLVPRLLQDFRKGVTAMRNMELLKWCSEYDFELFYNLIINFPTETSDDIQETINSIKFAKYFQPPHLAPYTLSIESPYHQAMITSGNMDYCKIQDAVAPLFPESVKHVLAPLMSTILGYEPKQPGDDISDWIPVEEAVKKWKSQFDRNHCRPSLLLRTADDFIVLTDRTKENEQHLILKGHACSVYLSCMDQACSIEQIQQTTGLEQHEIAFLLLEMQQMNILFASEGKYLSLAIQEEQKWN